MPEANAPGRPVGLAPRRFQIALLSVAGALIVFASGFSVQTVGKLRQSIDEVTHTLAVKEAVEEVKWASHDVDTFGLRYLLRFSDEHLRQHSLAINTVNDKVEHLRRLSGEHEDQLLRVAALDRALEERDEWFRAAIGQAQVLGDGAAAPQVRGGGDSALGTRIRLLLLEIESEENRRLLVRQQNLDGMLTQGSATVLLVNGLALAMAVVALLLLRHGSRELQVRREAELRAAEAERAAREKSEFLASMSHEIRTPMNAVLGFSQLLSRTRIEPQAQEYLKAIRTSGEALLALINDILDLSKIEAGKLSLIAQPVELRELADSTAGVFSEAANRKGLSLRTRVDPDVPHTLTIDPHRLRQVLMNLLSNAVKYTDQGEVELHVQSVRSAPGQADLLFRVRDSGRGIPAEQQARLFEPFHRAVSDREQTAGTGLGLAIVRRLSALLGGEVSFESVPGKGSEFTVRFPNARVDERIQDASGSSGEEVSFARIRHSRILIVDDVDWNRDLLRAFLAEGDHELAFASNGREALDEAERFKPDLVLMDLRMPVLDGREATRMLRENLGDAAPACIAVSASSMSREERALGDLFDGYVRKPVARDVLFAMLAEHLGTVDDDQVGEADNGGDCAPAEAVAHPVSEAGRETLQRMIADTLPQLQSTLRTGETKRFAEALVDLGSRESLPALRYFGQRLLRAVERFDVNAMESILAQGEEHLQRALDAGD